MIVIVIDTINVVVFTIIIFYFVIFIWSSVAKCGFCFLFIFEKRKRFILLYFYFNLRLNSTRRHVLYAAAEQRVLSSVVTVEMR